jgi:hypothetical protein
MKSTLYILLIILLFSFSKTLISQSNAEVLDQVYGLDQNLYNGKIYSYVIPPGTLGHPFLNSRDYSAGSITVKGRCYQNIFLNYDIFNQQLLLKYIDEKSSQNIIEVSKGWLTSFTFGNMRFEYLNLGQKPHFYQVLGEGQVRILYYWWKNLNLDVTIQSSNYTFDPTVRDAYVLMNGQLKPFSTKRSLVRLFDKQHRPEIKSYLRKNKIKMNKASDQVMAELITFIGNIR